ncbi:MAG: hypothetical protein ABI120_07525, partial [Gemmatimonadaceae bacterium]
MKVMLRALSLLLCMTAPAAAMQADPPKTPTLQVEVEGGAVWQSRNDVQIPNDAAGTRFSLVDAIGNGPWPTARLYATWNINEKHGLRLLLAPLRVSGTATLDSPIAFAGSRFAAGTPTDASYQFNSWRVTYRYRFHDGENWRWWVGFTAKVRDAKIRLAQGSEIGEKVDVGFVPLLHLAGTRRLTARWMAELDADALAGGPGRAEDVALKLRYRLRDRLSIAGGYRTVEGGANVDEVYNFAWLHYAVLSTRVSFQGVAVMATEEAKYTIVLKADRFELRKYESQILAQTAVGGDFEGAGSEA